MTVSSQHSSDWEKIIDYIDDILFLQLLEDIDIPMHFPGSGTGLEEDPVREERVSMTKQEIKERVIYYLILYHKEK